MKRFHYKCPGCKHHFKIIWRRSAFERPGLVKCFKCDDLHLHHKVIWESSLSVMYSRYRSNHPLDSGMLHVKIRKEVMVDNLYQEQWPDGALK